jgi:sugar phosphate isomerase/epimerase
MTDPTTAPVHHGVRVPPARVALSTASVYPESTAAGFEAAARLGYDAVEVMVGIDPVSQDIDTLRHLVEYHRVPVCAVHVPCLLITQRVWGSDPWVKVTRSVEMAQALGAQTVVVHPPFRWQRDYARDFVAGISRIERESGLEVAVENMYPWRASRRELQAYAPGWNPVDHDYAHVTLDLSHTATSGSDPIAMANDLGDRLHHVHMTDGSGSAKDEHLVPGRGTQPCAQLLELLAGREFAGSIVLEINTRKAASHVERMDDLAESLAYTRLHLAIADETYEGAQPGGH